MATNHYFHNYTNSMEQQLLDDLIVESIKIYGLDMYYMPITVVNQDSIFTEPEYAKFENAILVDMYIKNVDAYGGEGLLLGKFGVEVRDQMTLVIAQRTFDDEIGDYTTDSRPKEGDLIYIPMTDAAYKIMYVDPSVLFFQLGKLQTYELTCELFEYSSEVFNTGIEEIDDKYNEFSLDISLYPIADSSNTFMITSTAGEVITYTNKEPEVFDQQAQNLDIETEADEVIDFSETNPFGEI